MDVGCGTGISTRAFAATGHPVIGIDPNADMLATARAAGGADYLAGTSTRTGLAAASADLIVAAQAFHWFDLPATLREFARIGTERSMSAAFWNIRSMEAPFMAGYEDLLRRHSSEYEVNDRAMRTLVRLREVTGGRAREHAVEHGLPMDRERLRTLALSSSYVKHGVADLPAFLADLDALFTAHAANGQVVMRYVARAIAWPTQRVPSAG